MPKKEDLVAKLLKRPTPTNFTLRELDSLMSKCGCSKDSGGRGSSIRYMHTKTVRVLTFGQLPTA